MANVQEMQGNEYEVDLVNVSTRKVGALSYTATISSGFNSAWHTVISP